MPFPLLSKSLSSLLLSPLVILGLGLGLPGASEGAMLQLGNSGSYSGAGSIWTGGGGGGYKPPVGVTLSYGFGYLFLAYPFVESSAILTLPTLPDNGILELPAVQPTAIPVQVTGLPTLSATGSTLLYPHPDNLPVTYQWTENFAWSPTLPTAHVGSLSLRWFWNDQPISNIAAWLADGNNGKWGTYRVELWQYKETQGSPTAPGDESIHLGSDRYRISRRIAGKTFQVTIQGQTPLAPSTPPAFEVEPALPATVLLRETSVTLTTRANAGDPFIYRWFRDNVEIHRGSSLTVTADQVSEKGARYRCEVSNSQGKDSTPTWRIRKPHRPLVDLRGSTPFALEGGTLIFNPAIQSESGATCQWTGPALEAKDGRATVLENGTLEIRNARLEDSGEYRLTSTDVEGSSQHEITALVISLPVGAYPLAIGQTLQVQTPTSAPPSSALNIYWKGPVMALRHKDYAPCPLAFTCLRLLPTMLDRGQVVATASLHSEYDYFNGSNYQKVKFAPSFELASYFSFELPTQPAVMPAHSLPAGQVGRVYSVSGPGFVTAANGATRYTVSGLPRGLKAGPLGTLEGYPIQSGDFTVSFTASNSKGKAAPVLLPLHIAPLPAGVAGDWLLAGPHLGEEEGQILRLTILPTGAYSGKFEKNAVRGNVVVNADGSTDVGIMRIPPGGGNYAQENPPSEAVGWRNTWGKTAPVGNLAGRYNFHASPPHFPAGCEITPQIASFLALRTLLQQGHTSGSLLLGPDGRTTLTYYSSDSSTTLSSAFLGPHGEVHHDHNSPNAPRHFLLLKVEGTRIHGELPAPEQSYQVDSLYSYSSVKGIGSYMPSIDGRRLSDWPYPLITTYQGGRYTPPGKNALPSGFSAALTLNTRFSMVPNTTTSSYISASEGFQEAQLRSNGSVNLPLTDAVPHHATCKIHLPTGTFSGSIRLHLSTNSFSRPVAFQGCLVPQEDGHTHGWGRASAVLIKDLYFHPQSTFPVALKPMRGEE